MGEPLIVPFQQFGEAHPAQHLYGEDLLHAGFEAQESNRLAGLDIDHPHSTGALAHPLDQRDAAETALSRTCERPMKASGPTKSMPRVKPGSCATVCHVRRSRST